MTTSGQIYAKCNIQHIAIRIAKWVSRIAVYCKTLFALLFHPTSIYRPFLQNKRAKMALDRSPKFEITLANFSFFVAFREELTRISLCSYSSSSPHSPILRSLTDQNFAKNF